MPRPHAAAVLEDAYHSRKAGVLTRRGFVTRIVPSTGYGSVAQLRVFGRVILTRGRPEDEPEEPTYAARLRAVELETRGFRAFFATPAVDEPVTVRVNERIVTTRTDRGGYIDLTVRGHGLSPGWHHVYIGSPRAETIDAPVLVVGTTVTHGIISDLDDTVISTSLPRPMIAAWNTFMRSEGARKPVPGMATMYRELLAAHPGAPVVYLSTGAWNTAPSLTRFLRRSGFPAGPMLLTDWGPTITGWFRSGQDHKHAQLHRLARELPQVKWLLVGDDGQHDPKIYTEFASRRPDRVRGIAIRELSAGQQVLSHVIPVANDDIMPAPTDDLEVPVVRAPDGYALARRIRPFWQGDVPQRTLAARAASTVHPLEDPPAYLLPDPDER
ncbi:MAG TPA: phosphatase domain-containing protein [Ornithinibacter sp.]|nr:phosphatase domain-containing protein [Ornithinibacter sp.]